jgi:dTDP-4-dehydrorhamnose 3,5-epimerase-like enzyme
MIAKQPALIKINSHLDNNRSPLYFLDLVKTLDFVAKRFYFVTNMFQGEVRGNHGHKELRQIIICLDGALKVNVFHQNVTYEFSISCSSHAVYIPKDSWRSIESTAENSTMFVLASEEYDPLDYIHTRDDLKWNL